MTKASFAQWYHFLTNDSLLMSQNMESTSNILFKMIFLSIWTFYSSNSMFFSYFWSFLTSLELNSYLHPIFTDPLSICVCFSPFVIHPFCSWQPLSVAILFLHSLFCRTLLCTSMVLLGTSDVQIHPDLSSLIQNNCLGEWVKVLRFMSKWWRQRFSQG